MNKYLIRKLVTNELLNSLKLDGGIIEFFRFDDYCMGISYETVDKDDVYNESERYIFNIFAGFEYINISYVSGNKGLNDAVYQELADKWNEIVNIRKIITERISSNASIKEIEAILCEEVTADIIEDIDTHLEKVLQCDDMDMNVFGRILTKHLSPIEIGNITKMAFITPIDSKKILIKDIKESVSMDEIEEIIKNETINSNTVEDIDTYLENAFYSMDENKFGELVLKYEVFANIGFFCKQVLAVC